MSELSDVRKQIANARRNAVNKMSRVRRKSGAELAGSSFDPRRKVGIEKRYNLAQAKKYLSELKEFNHRRNQFVSGHDNAPLPRHRVNYLKQRAEAVKDAGKRHEDSISDTVTPHGVTPKQAKAMRPDSNLPRMRGNATVSGPYKEFDIRVQNITSANALEVFIKDVNKMLSPGYLKRKLNDGRDNILKALDILGEHEWADRVAELNDYQFNSLWFGSPGAIESLFVKYNIETGRNVGESRKEAYQNRVVENESRDFEEFLSWAENLNDPTEGEESEQTPNIIRLNQANGKSRKKKK